ncbi:hypothetical protein ACHHYP_20247 [Achlya hypogyna]|uniref:Uncharacterized protein n=1 Tax=Achlya hypogyna TaxID=1202772 RepID=A0A1V9ZNV6_ACHHY|nr:hypothetical protein ACHHYP_20247 [Achlya hypogyna]
MDSYETDESALSESGDSDTSSTMESPRSSLLVRRQYRLLYSDETVKERYDQIVRTTLRLANATETTNNVLLAQKAIKYRNRQRSGSVNYDDPALDIFQSLGIKWCKTP